ncbi:Flp family type IVb pilin [Arthrobacter ramosus]|uniref:Flp family type IVb pilin n=1 Tax=Arthrobacter ramosus TaxID=1672 RepID=A0ABV5XVK3_ARTRM|nr:Flp family type IVb pilin [Arthrobacter ramosus]
MFNFKKQFRTLQLLFSELPAERGATATEYSLLVGLIALVIVVGVGLFGTNLNAWFNSLATTVGTW